MRKSIIASVLSFSTLASGAALAQPDPTESKCRSELCVYADNGRGPVIGVENSVGANATVQRFLMGEWYQLNYSTSLGFDTNAILLYTQPGCLGQPYFNTGSRIGPADLIHPNAMRITSPLPAGYDGFGTVWGPVGPASVVNIASSEYENTCFSGTWGVNPQVVAPAVKLETRSFQLPWKIQ